MPAKLMTTGPATETEVRNIVSPKSTKSWNPISHGALLDEVDKALTEVQLAIDPKSRKFGLQHDGDQMFGIYQIVNHDNEDMGYGFSIGVRNSINKSLSAAICFGSRVFVCDNLAFSGEEVIARKHTTFIMRDLPVLVRGAIGKFEVFKNQQAKLFSALAQIHVELIDVHDLVCSAVKNNTIPAIMLPRVLAEYENPSYNDFQPRTLWSVYNSFTEILKPSFERNPLVASERTIRLTQLFAEQYSDELSAQGV